LHLEAQGWVGCFVWFNKFKNNQPANIALPPLPTCVWMLRSMGGAVSRSLQKQFGVKRSEAQVASGTWRPHCVKKGCGAPIAFGSSFFPFFLSFFLSFSPKTHFPDFSCVPTENGSTRRPSPSGGAGCRPKAVEVLVLKKKNLQAPCGEKTTGIRSSRGLRGSRSEYHLAFRPGLFRVPGYPGGYWSLVLRAT